MMVGQIKWDFTRRNTNYLNNQLPLIGELEKSGLWKRQEKVPDLNCHVYKKEYLNVYKGQSIELNAFIFICSQSTAFI